MRTWHPVVCLLGFALLVGGCRSGSSESYTLAGFDFRDISTVAVVEVGGAAADAETVKNQITDLFTMQLLKRGYAPINRQYVKRQLEQSNFPAGDLTIDSSAVEAGRTLQVPAVMIISVPALGKDASVTAKIISVADGSILWLGNGSAKRSRIHSSSSEDAEFEKAFQGSLSLKQAPEDQVKPPVDRALNSRELQALSKVVKGICKSLPYRSSELKPKRSFSSMIQFWK